MRLSLWPWGCFRGRMCFFSFHRLKHLTLNRKASPLASCTKSSPTCGRSTHSSLIEYSWKHYAFSWLKHTNSVFRRKGFIGSINLNHDCHTLTLSQALLLFFNIPIIIILISISNKSLTFRKMYVHFLKTFRGKNRINQFSFLCKKQCIKTIEVMQPLLYRPCLYPLNINN